MVSFSLVKFKKIAQVLHHCDDGLTSAVRCHFGSNVKIQGQNWPCVVEKLHHGYGYCFLSKVGKWLA